MSPSNAHVSARAVTAALNALATQGLPVDAYLAAAELDRASLADPDNRVPYEKLLRLWMIAVRESGDDHLGLHTAARIRPEDYEILGYLLRTCPTVAELLAGFSRYQRLLADAIEIRAELEGDLIRVLYTVPGYQLPRPLAEYVIGVVVVLMRAALQEEALAPREVCFAHPDPGNLAPYEELFRAPVRFDAPTASLLLDVDLNRPLPTPDTDLHRILRRHADELVERTGKNAFVAQVSRVVEERMLRGGLHEPEGGDEILAEHVAKALAVSTRSLRRQLGQHGTSLKSIADTLRRQVAMHYLASSQLSVGEIGFLVGFSEPSAFHRAFKRWTHETPAAFRNGAV